MDEVACSIYMYMSIYISMYICTLALVHLNCIYVLPLFVYSTPLAGWECDCVDEVAFSMHIYTSMDIVATVYTYCRYLIYIYMCLKYTYILPLFVSVDENDLEM